MLIRTALGTLAATALAAGFAAPAPAAIVPTVTLDQSAGTTAGSSPATGFDINLRPFASDSAKDIAISLPAGYMINLQAAGGVCLSAKSPIPACRLGTGTINGPGGTPAALFLVAAPQASDIAGIALTQEGGPTTTGDLALETSPALGETISLRLLPPGIAELRFTLEGARLPANCAPEQKVAVAAATWAGFLGSATAPLTVTGCSSLPFAPKLSATATRGNGEEATLAVNFAQGAGESSDSSLTFGIPSGMKLNRILLPCFQGTKCTIGSVAAVSPLLPAPALSDGTLTLTGSLSGTSLYTPISGASLTVAFPSPYPFQFVGPVSLSERVITYSGLPDIPLSSVTFTFVGTTEGSAFTTPCQRSVISATATPQDGNAPLKLSAPVKIVGCPVRPRAWGSLTGLAARAPRLRLHVSSSTDPADVSALSITLPAGLGFRATSVGRACPASASCKAVWVPGLQLAGTRIASAQAHGRSLNLTFTRPAATVMLDASGPLVRESGASARLHRRHATATPPARVRISDTAGISTTVKVR